MADTMNFHLPAPQLSRELNTYIYIFSIGPTNIFFMLVLYGAQIKSFQSVNLTIIPAQLMVAFPSSRISSLSP